MSSSISDVDPHEQMARLQRYIEWVDALFKRRVYPDGSTAFSYAERKEIKRFAEEAKKSFEQLSRWVDCPRCVECDNNLLR